MGVLVGVLMEVLVGYLVGVLVGELFRVLVDFGRRSKISESTPRPGK